jgi:hypothetical protein
VLLATRHTPTTPVDDDFETRNRRVPDWAKMGAFDLTTDAVQRDKKHLDYATFEASLQPYWKVGTLKDGWRKLYNLLWPTEEDPPGRTLDEKRSALTHAGLIVVIREMIDAIPAASDGAPSKQVVDDARARYSNSVMRLVNANNIFTPPLPLAPPVRGPSSYIDPFVNTTPDDFREGSPVKPTPHKRPYRGASAQHQSRNSRRGLGRLTGSTLPGGSGPRWESESTYVSDETRESKRSRRSVQGQQFLISPTFKIELFFLAQD